MMEVRYVRIYVGCRKEGEIRIFHKRGTSMNVCMYIGSLRFCVNSCYRDSEVKQAQVMHFQSTYVYTYVTVCINSYRIFPNFSASVQMGSDNTLFFDEISCSPIFCFGSNFSSATYIRS